MFYQKIERLCKERGISIARLEKETNIGNGTIGRWKESVPSLTSLKKIAEYFEIPLAELIE